MWIKGEYTDHLGRKRSGKIWKEPNPASVGGEKEILPKPKRTRKAGSK
jgi:hypothetical protein